MSRRRQDGAVQVGGGQVENPSDKTKTVGFSVFQLLMSLACKDFASRDE